MKNKKLLIIAAVVLSLAVLSLVVAKSHIINRQKTPAPTSPQGPTADQKQQAASVDANTKKQVVEDKATTNDATPATTPASKSISLTAQQEANSTVTIFTKLTEYSAGTCELIATNGAKTNTQSAAVIYQPEFSSCAGFSVPISSLDKGTWTLRLSVSSNGTTESKTISYEVK